MMTLLRTVSNKGMLTVGSTAQTIKHLCTALGKDISKGTNKKWSHKFHNQDKSLEDIPHMVVGHKRH